jgi:hypothetical protein
LVGWRNIAVETKLENTVENIENMTFDERLNWKEYIKDVKARATRKLNLLKSLSHT